MKKTTLKEMVIELELRRVELELYNSQSGRFKKKEESMAQKLDFDAEERRAL